MNLSQKEIDALKKLEVKENGIQLINTYVLAEDDRPQDVKMNKYILYLFTLVGMFAYALYFDTQKIATLAAFGTMILPVVILITSLSLMEKRHYNDGKVQLSKFNIFLIFSNILKHRVQVKTRIKLRNQVHLLCYIFITGCLVMFKNWFMLSIYLILLILFFATLNEKLKNIQSDFIQAINKQEEE